VFVSATPPSVSALTLPPKKNCQFPENSGVLFGVGVLHVRRPNYAPTLKKGQVDVFLLVLVSADNNNVTARLITDLFINTGSASFMPPNQKQPYPLKKSYRVGFR